MQHQSADDAPGHLFSEALESDAPIEAEDTPEDGPSLFARVKALLAGKTKESDSRYGQLEKTSLAIAEEVSALKGETAAKADGDALEALRADFDALKALP